MTGIDLGSVSNFTGAVTDNVFGVVGSTISTNIAWAVVACAALLGVVLVRMIWRKAFHLHR